MWLFGKKSAKKSTRLFFATDLHGSELTFRKFVNAGKFYEANVLVMGGDIIGKLAIPIIKGKNGHYRAKDLYEASPGARYKLGSLPMITVLGVLGGILGTLMVLAFLFSPALGVLGNWNFEDFPANSWAQIIAFGIILVSALWYFLAKNAQKSRGINVEYAFKEIPPE